MALLLVEDDGAVRTLVRNTLIRHGYQVLEAGSGAEALRVWADHKAQVALLLTDMVMPGGMTGADLAEALRAERPSLPVLYTSGYSDEMLGAGSALRDSPRFLEKPFAVATMLRAVRRCLDGD